MSQPTWWRGGRGLPSLIALLMYSTATFMLTHRIDWFGKSEGITILPMGDIAHSSSIVRYGIGMVRCMTGPNDLDMDPWRPASINHDNWNMIRGISIYTCVCTNIIHIFCIDSCNQKHWRLMSICWWQKGNLIWYPLSIQVSGTFYQVHTGLKRR